MKINKNFIIVGVLILLVLIAAAQSFQLIGMKKSVSEISPSSSGGISSASLSEDSGSSSSGSGSGSGVPTNLQNLPGMVGGC